MLAKWKQRIAAFKVKKSVSEATIALRRDELNKARAQMMRLELLAAEVVNDALEAPDTKQGDMVLAAVGLLQYRVWLHSAKWHAPDGENIEDLV